MSTKLFIFCDYVYVYFYVYGYVTLLEFYL